MEQKQSQGLGVRVVNFIKKTDAFGTPVSFTYKSETCIKSFFGGFFTCMARLGVLIYLLVQCLKVLHRDKIVQTTILKRDLTLDKTENVYTLQNFDFAVRLEYQFYEKQPDIQENIDQYVYLGVTSNSYTWIEDLQGEPLQKKEKWSTILGSCYEGRVGLSNNGPDYLGLKKGYSCPESINYYMKGSFSSEQAKFFQVRLGYCNQTYLNQKYNKEKQCKDRATQDIVAANMKLYFVVQNSYFDTDDFSETPIKKYLKPYYLTTKNSTSMYYYMLLSSNKAKYNDGMLFGTPNESEFIETRMDYQITQEVPAQDGSPNAFISIYIQMDDTYKVITREVSTFITALQATGGFMTIIFVLTSMIVNQFSKTIYNTSLIKSFYKYQKLKQTDGQPNLDSSDDDKDLNKKVTDGRITSDKDQPFSDRFKEEKSLIFNRLIEQIQNRKKLTMGLLTLMINKFKKLICKKLNNKQKFRELLFSKGIAKIEKELDIRTIAKQLKTLKFISQILLTKYQRFMISEFKENLLNHKLRKENTATKVHKKQLQKSLVKMIVNCNNSKLDQRMIKNIDLSQDDEAINQITDNGRDRKSGKMAYVVKKQISKKKRSHSQKFHEVDHKLDMKKTIKDFNIDELIKKQSQKTKHAFKVDEDFNSATIIVGDQKL